MIRMFQTCSVRFGVEGLGTLSNLRTLEKPRRTTMKGERPEEGDNYICRILHSGMTPMAEPATLDVGVNISTQ